MNFWLQSIAILTTEVLVFSCNIWNSQKWFLFLKRNHTYFQSLETIILQNSSLLSSNIQFRDNQSEFSLMFCPIRSSFTFVCLFFIIFLSKIIWLVAGSGEQNIISLGLPNKQFPNGILNWRSLWPHRQPLAFAEAAEAADCLALVQDVGDHHHLAVEAQWQFLGESFKT